MILTWAPCCELSAQKTYSHTHIHAAHQDCRLQGEVSHTCHQIAALILRYVLTERRSDLPAKRSQSSIFRRPVKHGRINSAFEFTCLQREGNVITVYTVGSVAQVTQASLLTIWLSAGRRKCYTSCRTCVTAHAQCVPHCQPREDKNRILFCLSAV